MNGIVRCFEKSPWSISMLKCGPVTLFIGFALKYLLQSFHMEAFLPSVRSGQVYHGSISFDEVTGEPYMIMAIPMFEVRSGQVWGA